MFNINFCFIQDDSENVVDLIIKNVLDGHSILIFCMTKAHCEALAVKIAKETIKIGLYSKN